jgi:hypothetical protein
MQNRKETNLEEAVRRSNIMFRDIGFGTQSTRIALHAG